MIDSSVAIRNLVFFDLLMLNHIDDAANRRNHVLWAWRRSKGSIRIARVSSSRVPASRSAGDLNVLATTSVHELEVRVAGRPIHERNCNVFSAQTGGQRKPGGQIAV
jgi:hypothetical protein